MKRIHALATSLLLAAGVAQAATVHGEDFESGSKSAGWSGAGTVQSTGSFASLGFGQQHLRVEGASAAVLTLNNLGAHSAITLSFDLVLWDSIDGNPGGFPYGDLFQLLSHLGIHRCTGRLTVIGKAQQLADVVEAETQRSAAANEQQSVAFFFRVGAGFSCLDAGFFNLLSDQVLGNVIG